MANEERTYLCIDLKSFYASVECVERGLDPLTTDLVVADPERSEKTICLAVSPSLKAKGVRNRCRVFEIPKTFEYIMAPPRMQFYINYSAEIYGIYLKYLSKDDIHVYSIDEAFMDVTRYLPLYGCTARELGNRIRQEILDTVGIPATCGIGPNLYLAKIALDITAKHSPDFFGELDEDSFKMQLWDHTPLTDFWRIGKGTERRLHELGIHNMGQLAMYPRKDKLYDAFGVDAEILIDHAWGLEPVTIADIKAYRPQSHSMTNAQVLPCGYSFDEARTVLKEMVDNTCLSLVSEERVADSMTLFVRYQKDEFGDIPTSAGTARFDEPTNSLAVARPHVLEVFDRTVPHDAVVRAMNLSANNIHEAAAVQMSLFCAADAPSETELAEETARQKTILDIKAKFGKNSLLRGTDLLPKATQQERNKQIGGHKSGE